MKKEHIVRGCPVALVVAGAFVANPRCNSPGAWLAVLILSAALLALPIPRRPLPHIGVVLVLFVVCAVGLACCAGALAERFERLWAM